MNSQTTACNIPSQKISEPNTRTQKLTSFSNQNRKKKQIKG